MDSEDDLPSFSQIMSGPVGDDNSEFAFESRVKAIRTDATQRDLDMSKERKATVDSNPVALEDYVDLFLKSPKKTKKKKTATKPKTGKEKKVKTTSESAKQRIESKKKSTNDEPQKLLASDWASSTFDLQLSSDFDDFGDLPTKSESATKMPTKVKRLFEDEDTNPEFDFGEFNLIHMKNKSESVDGELVVLDRPDDHHQCSDGQKPPKHQKSIILDTKNEKQDLEKDLKQTPRICSDESSNETSKKSTKKATKKELKKSPKKNETKKSDILKSVKTDDVDDVENVIDRTSGKGSIEIDTDDATTEDNNELVRTKKIISKRSEGNKRSSVDVIGQSNVVVPVAKKRRASAPEPDDLLRFVTQTQLPPIGLKLGLSRNRRVSTPLHKNVMNNRED